MNKSKAGIWVGLAVFFAAAVYSLIVLLVKTGFDLSAWVLYGSTIAAFLLLGVQAIAASRSGSGIVMDTALGIITVIYFSLQLVFGGIICMCFHDLPHVPVIVCEIILLAVYLVIAFIMYAAQSSNTAQDQNDQKTVRKMLLLENDIQCMMDEVSDPDVKKALKELAEAVHYSDVVSLPGLADVEGRIARNTAVLQEELMNEGSRPFATIEAIRKLLRERDRTAAILKR